MSTIIDDIIRMATLSDEPEPLYRYVLGRRWGGEADGRVNFVMLNPSTADGLQDDPTIRRCVGFVKSWGYGELIVTNLFAFRSTDPKRLKRVTDPSGPLNDGVILHNAVSSGVVVCAWGAHGTLYGRDRAVLRLLKGAGVTPHYLKLTAGGCPQHPLYLSGSLVPQEWR
jgi:hypothetical protein